MESRVLFNAIAALLSQYFITALGGEELLSSLVDREILVA